ncbi:hypothetical protein PHYSODRAFT_338826 [Phytophthora sojae]|uniref:WRKY19-like zinc finger domain-containing protein n=1 Tax=Phytophthora sojae (strain P6497) TaxID=1094619 RepID=G5A399_PHYSP|nr:hypothetical protein PHYSODRAFT_338826 [Phytophthora sojae]EGZ10139.1 hypothetical protein PHYSODRAFT_338826 [Phytophthora sojae]|eukprot:XP_009535000.1 hypothetical protein PHYSODRAFT_338826 [Phytophthora sojae]
MTEDQCDQSNMVDSKSPRNADIDRLHEKLQTLRDQQNLDGDKHFRDRFCANTQRLLQAALEDPHANSSDAQIALKALRYRKVLHRLDGLDPQDPTFGVSTFFGVEWCKGPALATSVGGVLGAPICATPEVQQSVVEELNLQDALPSTTETLADSGDRDQYSALGGDREFFLDEFDTDSTFITTPRVLSQEDEHEVVGYLSRGVFMRGSRSATQQAKGELALQMWWGEKFAAGRLHSMIRCMESSSLSDDEEDDQTSSRLTATGRPCCSEPGCTNQVQMKGKCMRHEGVSHCKHPGCESTARWHGVCVEHGGRRVCSEDNCSKLIRSAGKCEEHGGRCYKQCSHPGCTSKVQKRGLCVPHGGFAVCKTEGCEARASSKGLCKRHGGAKMCQVEGCEKAMSNRGYCYKHGVEKGVVKVHQKPKCKADGCLKIQMCHGFCSRHAQERGFTVGKTCKVKGCTKISQSRGCCLSHGGGTRCKISDCNRPIVTKGLCAAHGGRKTCKVEGCEKWGLSSGQLKGYCVQHGGGTRCKHPGCNKSVQYKGLCCVHGGKLKCDAEGCDTNVRVKGYCAVHER